MSGYAMMHKKNKIGNNTENTIIPPCDFFVFLLVLILALLLIIRAVAELEEFQDLVTVG